MGTELLNCWEIKNCERQKGGMKVYELGECIASKSDMGHSCWAIAGTFCGGEVQGTYAQKLNNCMACEFYQSFDLKQRGLARKDFEERTGKEAD